MAIIYYPSMSQVVITGYSEVTPCTFQDIHDADKAGTLNLISRTGLSAIDGAPINNTYNLSPTDDVLLGGTKNDLYITVANWTGVTSVTIRLIGTDENDTVLTEDIIVTGNGTVNATKLFKTLTQTQVTVVTGTGSFDYILTQGRWGIIGKQGSCYELNCKMRVGDFIGTVTWLKTENERIIFGVGFTDILDIRLGATVLIGEDSITSRGSTVEFYPSISSPTVRISQRGTLKIYKSSMVAGEGGINEWQSILNRGTTIIRNAIFQGLYFGIVDYAGSKLDIGDNTLMQNGSYVAIYLYGGGEVILNDVQIKNYTRGVYVQRHGTFRVKNVEISESMFVDIAFSISLGTTADLYMINSTFSTFFWDPQGDVCTVYKQYEFDLKVVDMYGNAINGATVKIRDLTNNLILNKTTNVDGYVGEDSGTATSGTPITLIDTSKSWTVDEWRSYEVVITGGTGAGQSQTVKSNTANTLTTNEWAIQPDSTSRYILTTVLNYGYYNKIGNTVPYMQTPHTLEIFKTGYEPYKKEFTADKKIDWTISLKPARVQIDQEHL